MASSFRKNADASALQQVIPHRAVQGVVICLGVDLHDWIRFNLISIKVFVLTLYEKRAPVGSGAAKAVST